MVFEATHQARDGLHWHIDDRYMGSIEVVHEMPVARRQGPVLTVVDEQGARVTRSFAVADAGR